MTAVKNPNESNGGSAAMVAVGAIVAFFVVAFIAAKLLGSEDAVAIDSDGFEASEVVLEGTLLDQMPANLSVSTDPAGDSAIGRTAPTLTGQNFSGDPVEILNDGRAKAIYFVAHWCPHCQVEVPMLTELIANGDVPADMDIYLVSTSVESGATNYPPSAWLDGAGWPTPIIRDDNTSKALINFGAGGFPYAVYLNAGHQVVARAAGETSPEITTQLWNGAVSAEVIPETIEDDDLEASDIGDGAVSDDAPED